MNVTQKAVLLNEIPGERKLKILSDNESRRCYMEDISTVLELLCLRTHSGAYCNRRMS